MFTEMIDSIVGFGLSMLPLLLALVLIIGGLVTGLLIFGPMIAVFFQPHRKKPGTKEADKQG